MGQSNTSNAQFWALEHPLSAGYAGRYGIPPQNVSNADFIQSAVLRSGSSFVTRIAPPVGANPGGGIEVVTQEGGIVMQSFNVTR